MLFANNEGFLNEVYNIAMMTQRQTEQNCHRSLNFAKKKQTQMVSKSNDLIAMQLAKLIYL